MVLFFSSMLPSAEPGTMTPSEDVGVPWLSAPDRGLALLLKSGNFGGEDLFSRAAVRVAA